MRLVDVLLSIPGLPLLILISSLFSPGPVGLAFVLAFVSWPGIARIIRGEVLALRGREYVDAARSLGASSTRGSCCGTFCRTWCRCWWSTSRSVIPGLILAETGLSFLGIGVQVPTPPGATCLATGSSFSAPTSAMFIPGLMIYITSLRCIWSAVVCATRSIRS